jgi:hypothetical protein
MDVLPDVIIALGVALILKSKRRVKLKEKGLKGGFLIKRLIQM